jgi:DNA repair photolyase
MADGSAGKKPIRGPREWAVAEINCSRGCPHGCRYCYARYDLVVRKTTVTPEQWTSCRVLDEEVARKRPLYPGQVMFPSAHDIVPENLEACLGVLRNLVDAGNRVLVVSKPHLDCIHRLCSEFSDAREQLLFRFTITARDKRLLQLWEPHAPGYEERKDCLEYAFRHGFATSVSVEPMLDTTDVAAMVDELLPFITHSIWLGKMNRIERRVACESIEMQKEVARIEKGQSDERLLQLYHELRTIPQLRWKESVKEVVGLEQASEPGLDV